MNNLVKKNRNKKITEEYVAIECPTIGSEEIEPSCCFLVLKLKGENRLKLLDWLEEKR